MRQLLRRFDRDGDGQLSVREAPRRIAEAFDRVDADANGQLDRTELTRVAETMARMQTFAGRELERPRGAAGPRPSSSDPQPANRRRRLPAK
jgi:Ca2+-binding EF-hand superfamily protein